MATKDIFISYKNDGEGNNFAARLNDDLEKEGYKVYFNSMEQNAGSFPERLESNIKNCKDFILVLSSGCLQQLMDNNEIDWVREEILCAKKHNKNILPILIGDAKMPKDKKAFPTELQFLGDLEAVLLPEQYVVAPFNRLVAMFKSIPLNGQFQDVANGNENYNVHQDFINTLEKAKNSDDNAMFEIACMYHYGTASEKDEHAKIDYAEASRWLKALIKKYEGKESVPDFVVCAQVMLANLYYTGSVIREDQSFKKTIQILENLPKNEQEDDFSFERDQEKVLYMMSDGVGTAFDMEEVCDYFKKYESEGSNHTKNNISKFYVRYGMYKEAIELMESVDDEYPDMEYRLGIIYLQGLHTNPPKPNVDKAVNHLKTAAEQGHLEALYSLAKIHSHGQYGHKVNFKSARKYYLEAAEKGHTESQYSYAWMCRYGLGGKPDVAEAIRYFEKAALQGMSICKTELAELYQEPECRDYEKAFDWASQAADTGDRLAYFILGNLYFFGRGCEADLDEAAYNYQKAYNRGLYQAKFMLDKLENME